MVGLQDRSLVLGCSLARIESISLRFAIGSMSSQYGVVLDFSHLDVVWKFPIGQGKIDFLSSQCRKRREARGVDLLDFEVTGLGKPIVLRRDCIHFWEENWTLGSTGSFAMARTYLRPILHDCDVLPAIGCTRQGQGSQP